MSFEDLFRDLAEGRETFALNDWARPSLESDPEDCPRCSNPRPILGYCALCQED